MGRDHIQRHGQRASIGQCMDARERRVLLMHPLHMAVGVVHRCPLGQRRDGMPSFGKQPSKPHGHERHRTLNMHLFELKKIHPGVPGLPMDRVSLSDHSLLLRVVHCRGRRPHQQRHIGLFRCGLQLRVKVHRLVHAGARRNSHHPFGCIHVDQRFPRRPCAIPPPRQHFNAQTSQSARRVDG